MVTRSDRSRQCLVRELIARGSAPGAGHLWGRCSLWDKGCNCKAGWRQMRDLGRAGVGVRGRGSRHSLPAFLRLYGCHD